MSIDFAAAVIDPVLRIASNRAILPGPIRSPVSKSMRIESWIAAIGKRPAFAAIAPNSTISRPIGKSVTYLACSLDDHGETVVAQAVQQLVADGYDKTWKETAVPQWSRD